MTYLSDAEIARIAAKAPIENIAGALGLSLDDIEFYGKYKAKINYSAIDRLAGSPDGRLILVTAVSPTPAGEGKTTISIGLADALRKLGKNAALALREPSLGPVFGMKGGATGGGYSQALPIDEINLHFTGDLHAVAAANNLLAAIIDNHIYHGNRLGIDPRSITWKRCVDLNDRQLRSVISGLSGKSNGMPREDGFEITAATETMAILCLSESIAQLTENLRRITVGSTWDGAPVTAGDLKAHGAMAALLYEALKPNLVQTIERTPAFIHGGPFANIAHGCNSVIATKLALKLADFVVTEAGFGADLGAEKFCDIKCRIGGFAPSACVIVATVRAMKHHGGAPAASLGEENLKRLELGMPNLFRHAKNLRDIFNIQAVVAINRFPGDTPAELALLKDLCGAADICAVVADVWAKGGDGGVDLAGAVLSAAGAADAADTAGVADTAVAAITAGAADAACTTVTADAACMTGATDAACMTGATDAACTTGATVAACTTDAANTADAAHVPSASFRYAYEAELPILDKIETVARRVYGADGVIFSPGARREAARLDKQGLRGLPVCIAKTQYSFTDNPKKLGAPTGFSINIRSLKAQTGAGFIVAFAGDIMTMPGLPKSPAAERISIGEDGEIQGLY